MFDVSPPHIDEAKFATVAGGLIIPGEDACCVEGFETGPTNIKTSGTSDDAVIDTRQEGS
jgi:hypothetical protein